MLADLLARRFGVGHAVAEAFDLDLQFRRLGGECVLLDGPRKVTVQEPLLHLLQFGQALAGLTILFLAQAALIVAGGGQVPTKPVAALVVRDAKRGEVILDGLFESVLPPADHGMVGGGLEVAAAVIDVLVDLAALHAANDAFTRDAVPAVSADEHAAGEVVVGLASPAILAFEQVLAAFKDLKLDDWLVLAGEGLPAERHHSDIEAVVEDVRQRRAVEARVTGLVGEALALQHVGDVLERVEARRVQLEDALHGQGVDRVRLNRLVAVAGHVLVAVRCKARCPPLADLLLDALKHLVAKVV